MADLVQRYMNWNEKSYGALLLKRVCGILKDSRQTDG